MTKSRLFIGKDARSALEYFAKARTELRKRSSKLQGVDTPSQKRYITQVASWLNQIGAKQGSGVAIQKVPQTEIVLHHLTVSKYFSEPEEEECGPLVAAVYGNFDIILTIFTHFALAPPHARVVCSTSYPCVVCAD